jgi:YHS domain-containing protein
MQPASITSWLAPFICVAAMALFGRMDDKPNSNPDASNAVLRRASQRALEPLNEWVGGWRGVGQPKRGSNKGAWTEEAEWAWKIDRDRAGLQFEIKEGKQLESGLLTFDASEKKYRFVAKLPGGESRTYIGGRGEDGKVILTSDAAEGEDQHRLTFQMRHEDRMLLLLEARSAGQATFARVAEIGYTRKGGSFEYKGKTYYVCCTGCKAAFQEDPEGIIAEAGERAKAERAKKNSQ